ncbi:UspA domain protein [Haloterrigena turkmenica DSM 5511]|uniref:UspA domain protein n=1 Tax=Haloterrigena turkmenica (strain ATCC 51198 / DSM 5511 / JCM 9101 / NCIMB 13204 / VKM B-1734 / 4k) TaxID=543526 RepID=D2RW82_HALTV|nr:HPP family protein [Haloterrigena turkmenica]ADB59471.1 UspA domain protein [Haloterrigena turkmenica DSM 5511]
MLESVLARLRATRRRLRRLERRELDAFVRWIEHTGNLIHLSVLLFVPLLIAAVTWLANATAVVSFLLFPPLASGTYTLFADPEGRYSTPTKFVGGMTAGALCGWLAIALVDAAGIGGVAGVSATGAALGIFLTGAVTWALDLEEPTAFSTALLVLVSGNAQVVYVLGIVVSSSFVAAVFVVWRDRFYERRAQYLYRTTDGDDHVLVPLDEDWAEDPGDGETAPVARFAAELASAHDAGKLVLFDTVDDGDEIAETEPGPAARRLESFAADLSAEYGIPCEVVVAAGDRTSALALRTAREHNCDLIVTPYAEREGGGLSPFIVGLFDSEIDVIAFRSAENRQRWEHALVPVRGAGDTARAMVDFAQRITGSWHPTSVCTCIDRESERRDAETTVADLVDAFEGRFETHVVTEPVESYLERLSPRYDVIFVGSSTDRSAASRFVSPPTFERLSDLETDVAIVHRGRHR